MKYHGVTLIELLISITISLVLFNLLISLYITALHSRDLQDQWNQLQENSRMAIHFLREGCANSNAIVTLGDNQLIVRFDKNSNTYFIRHDALYVKDIHGRVVQLVQGVKSMKFHYDVNQQNQIIGISIKFIFMPLEKIGYAYITLGEKNK